MCMYMYMYIHMYMYRKDPRDSQGDRAHDVRTRFYHQPFRQKRPLYV